MSSQRPPSRRRRDRRGRGLRGELLRAGTGEPALDAAFRLPPALPDGRTRAERFHLVVDAALEQLEERWAAELATIDWDFDDVPPLELLPPAGSELADIGVPLSHTLPASGSGAAAQPALILLFRRPIEARARDRLDLADLVFDILVHDLADLLGRTPEEIDPEGHGG